MNPKPTLEQLLSDWSEKHDPSPEQFNQLSDNVLNVIAKTESAEKKLAPEKQSTSSVWLAVLSIAAVVLLVVSVAVWATSNDKSTENIAEVSTSPIERFTDNQKLEKGQLLAELDQLFRGRRVWFAETGTDVVLGDQQRLSASDVANQSAVVMRLVLAKRSDASDLWREVWSADVVARSDQLVQFTTTDSDSAEAAFTGWTHLLPDGMIACDVDLKWTNGQSVQLSESMLVSPNETQQGRSSHHNGIEYRLFQVVSLLDEKVAS